jgi:hypothetical protein
MPHRKNWRRPSGKSLLTIVVTAVVAVAALIYFLPRESKFGYVYEVNKPWRYPQLIASYDFPIYKTDAEVQRERDSITENFLPYYVVDTLAAQEHIQALRKDFLEGRFTGVATAYLPRLVALLRQAYARGIMDFSEQERLVAAGSSMHLVSGKEALVVAPQDFYTIRTAYDALLHNADSRLPAAVIRQCDLNNYLVPNIVADTAKNRLELEGELAQVLTNCGMVQSGQLIIDRGQIVSREHVKILDSLKKESERRMDPSRGYWFIFTGQTLYVLFIIGILLVYLRLFRYDYFDSPHSVLLLFSLVTLFPLITYVMMEHHFYSVYLVPYAIVPMFVRIFLDSRTSFMALVTSSLLSALALHAPYEFLVHQLVTGLVVIYSLRELTERSQLLWAVGAVVGAGLLISITYDLSQGLNWDAFDRSRSVYIIIGGVLLLFAYPMMYVVERLFGFTSSVTLVELSNINHPLLRKMSKVAQGTFNHSMQVANLATEVADAIGAKPLLVRTGALYHDIGKLQNPTYFTENQNGVNPHDSLPEERSAEIIIAHVYEGLRLAEKYHLPAVIRDFIRTHHGAGLTKYFYIQYCNKHPETPEPDKRPFSYPGPAPRTREQAVLMMCDSVEAASRSIKEYTEENISALVNRIVDGQLADGCFRECPLTFRDVADAKRVLIEALKTAYHTRISYPELHPQQPAKNTARQGFFGPGRFGGRRFS